MKREDLKDLELSKEVIDKIMELHGKDIESTKAKTEEKIKSDYEKQISERDKQLEELKKVDVTAYEQKIKEIQEENLKSKTDFENQLKQTKIDLSIENALIKAGAKNAQVFKSMVDTTKIIVDNDKIIGLDEQLESIKKDYAWGFGTEQEIITTGQQQTPNNQLSADEQYIQNKYKDNPYFKG
jgi:hypothetical protein